MYAHTPVWTKAYFGRKKIFGMVRIVNIKALRSGHHARGHKKESPRPANEKKQSKSK